MVFHGTADATVHPSNAEALVAAAGPALHGTPRHEKGRSEGGRPWSRELIEAPDGTPLVESWRMRARAMPGRAAARIRHKRDIRQLSVFLFARRQRPLA